MKTLTKLIFLQASFLLVQACSRNEAAINISVSAKRPDGSPVALASVSLDGEVIGETNAFGTFKLKTKTSSNKQHTLAVSFEDPSYYYSPHRQKFKAHSESETAVTIQAIMYLAPKPKAYDEKKAQEKLAANESHTSPVTEKNPTETAPDNTPQLLDITPYALSETPKAMLPEAEKKAQTIFTAHVASGAGPIAGAEVQWAESGRVYSSCTTNERGRCVLSMGAHGNSVGSVMVRKTGYQSSIKSIQPEPNQNLRVNLAPGTSLDVQAFSRKGDLDIPLSGVRFSEKDVLAATSDINGYAVIPLSNSNLNSNSTKLKVGIPGKQDPITLETPKETDRVWPLRIPVKDTSSNQTLLIHDIHVPKESTAQLTSDQLTKASDALLAMSGGVKAKTSLKDPTLLQGNQVSLIPVLSPGKRTHKIKLIAVDPAEKQIWSVELADEIMFDENLPLKIEGLLFDVRQKLQTYGVVEEVRQGELVIAMDSTQIRIGDRVKIRPDSQEFEADVAKTKENRVIAKLVGKAPAAQEWLLLGAKVTRELSNVQGLERLADILTDLEPRLPEKGSIAAAKKFIAENNPKDALGVLRIVENDDVPTKITKLNMSAQINFTQHQNPEALSLLYRALEFAVSSRFSAATTLIEININTVKSEILPAFAGDPHLIEALQELQVENSRLQQARDSVTQKNQDVERLLEHTATILKKKIVAAELKQEAAKL